MSLARRTVVGRLLFWGPAGFSTAMWVASVTIALATSLATAAAAQSSEPLSFRVGDTARFDVVGRFQLDGRSSGEPTEDASALDLARKRVGLHGELGKRFAFQVEAELNATEPWRDVYAGYRAFGALKVQVGQFKIPFSLDENTGSTKLDFVYRSRAATYLAPGRDRGVMFEGRLLRRVLKYEAGMFLRDGGKTNLEIPDTSSTGRTAAFRVTTLPFARTKSSLSDLQVGLAFSAGETSAGISTLRGRTALGDPFFPGTYYWVNGARRRTGVEVRWRPGPFSVASEYIRLTEERLGQAVTGGDLSPLLGAGWYLSGTWAVTGGAKADGLDRPRSPLFRGGFGAVEVAVRFERLDFGSTGTDGLASYGPRADRVATHSDRLITLGLNWYLNRWLKVQGNILHDTFDTNRGALAGGSPSWGRVVRLQASI